LHGYAFAGLWFNAAGILNINPSARQVFYLKVHVFKQTGARETVYFLIIAHAFLYVEQFLAWILYFVPARRDQGNRDC
jgi:hypothetical protein